MIYCTDLPGDNDWVDEVTQGLDYRSRAKVHCKL